MANVSLTGLNTENVESKISNIHSNLLIISDYDNLKQALEILNKKTGFLLVYSNNQIKHSSDSYPSIIKILEHNIDNELNFILYRKVNFYNNITYIYIKTNLLAQPKSLTTRFPLCPGVHNIYSVKSNDKKD